MGAQAFSSFDTLLAPFVKKDNLSYKEVKQCIQSFVYGVNTPSRWGTQSPFSNITIDWNCPDDLKDQPAIVGGVEQDFTYGDCKAEMDMINKAFMEIMNEGDYDGKLFSYPIPTYSITKDFDWSESENLKLLFGMAAKYGIPYFSNYINSDMNPSDVRSMCPLTSDTLLLVRSYKGISVQPIAQLFKQKERSADMYPYQVWSGSSWEKARVNKQEPTDVLEIKFSNGVTERLGINHLQPVITSNGISTLKAEDLKEGMDVPFNICSVDGEMLGSYELGYVVGAYLGDGSHDEDGIVYSLSENKRNNVGVLVVEIVRNFFIRLGFNVSVKMSSDSGLLSVRVGQGSYSLVKRFFDGNDALTKKLNRTAFTMSTEFRFGLLNGFQDTDGSQKSKRFYTSSPELRDSMCHLLASLGIKYRKGYIDIRDNRISPNSKPNYRIDYTAHRCYGEYYRQGFGYSLVRIESIKRVPNSEPLYCMEVDNQDHLFMLASGLITHNCRLRLDLREIIKKKGGGFFGSGDKTGSTGVVSLNFPKLAYLSKDKEDFYKRLDNLMDIAARSLAIKRETVTRLMENGLYPYTKRYIGSFDTYFNTIATVGMNEMCLNANWIKKNIASKEGQEFTIEVLHHILDRLPKYQQEYGYLFNLESAPAESTCYRLAKHDKEKYPDIITAGTDKVPYYTNSSNLPVGYTANLYEALEHQDPIQTLYTSGTVFHIYLGERLPDWKAAATIIKKVCENYRLPYITLSPTFSICPEHGYIPGEHTTCPHCK